MSVGVVATHVGEREKGKMLLSIANANPAAAPYRELFDDMPLARETAYAAALRELEAFLATRPGIGPAGTPLLEFLRGPLRAAPHSLAAQLEFIREAWSWLLGDLIERMSLAFDLRREEARWLAARAAAARGDHFGGGDASAPDYAGSEFEEERFSDDAEYIEHAYGDIHGGPAIRKWICDVMAPFPTMTFPIDWMVVDEDKGAIVWGVQNAFPEPFQPNGEPYSFPNWSRLVYAGKIGGIMKWKSEEDIYNPARDSARVFKSWVKAGGRTRSGEKIQMVHR